MYRILIVEDDRGIAESIREQANMWGFTAKCAAKFSNIMEEFIVTKFGRGYLVE